MDISFSFPPKLGTYTADPTISGFTPVDRIFPRLREGADAKCKFAREVYQRQVLYGFTTRELTDLDVITDRALRGNCLPDRIHPIFERKNWQTAPHPDCPTARIPDMPPGFGGNGKWTAENDLVWEAIFPSIQIVSMFLERIHYLPWFTALLVDSIPEESIEFRKQVDRSRIRPRDRTRMETGSDPLEIDDILTFSCPVPLTRKLNESTKQKLDLIWGEIYKNFDVHIGIKDTTEDPWDHTGAPAPTMGVSMTTERTVFMFYSYALIAPLLRHDLTDCERMGVQYHIATIMFHELMHVLYQIELRLHYRKGHSVHEPYYENSASAECGFSSEFAAFGASPFPMMIQHGEEFKSPVGYWILTNRNAVDWAIRTVEIVLIEPELEENQLLFPIKASLFEDMQQVDFWNAGIDLFGLEILHNRSLVEGVAINFRGLMPDNEINMEVFEELLIDSSRFTQPIDSILLFREKLKDLIRSTGQEMTPDQRKLMDFGWRIIHNSVWEESFWKYNNFMKAYVEEVIPTLSYVFDTSDSETTTKTLDRLVNFLETTRTRHQNVIDILLMIEHTSSIKDTARRLNLLNLNRGARIYAAEVMQLAQESGVDVFTPQWDEELIGLDFARLCLYDQSVYWRVPSLLKESESLTKAYVAMEAGGEVGDNSHFQYAYDLVAHHIFNPHPEATLFAKICARIIASKFPEMKFTDPSIPEGRFQTLETSLSYARTAVRILKTQNAFREKMVARAASGLKARYMETLAESQHEYKTWMDEAKESVKRLEGLVAEKNAKAASASKAARRKPAH